MKKRQIKKQAKPQKPQAWQEVTKWQKIQIAIEFVAVCLSLLDLLERLLF